MPPPSGNLEGEEVIFAFLSLFPPLPPPTLSFPSFSLLQFHGPYFRGANSGVLPFSPLSRYGERRRLLSQKRKASYPHFPYISTERHAPEAATFYFNNFLFPRKRKKSRQDNSNKFEGRHWGRENMVRALLPLLFSSCQMEGEGENKGGGKGGGRREMDTTHLISKDLAFNNSRLFFEKCENVIFDSFV